MQILFCLKLHVYSTVLAKKWRLLPIPLGVYYHSDEFWKIGCGGRIAMQFLSYSLGRGYWLFVVLLPINVLIIHVNKVLYIFKHIYRHYSNLIIFLQFPGPFHILGIVINLYFQVIVFSSHTRERMYSPFLFLSHFV